MKFTIRKMQKEDISHVQNIAKTSWNDTYEGIIPVEIQEGFLEMAYNVEMMNKRLENSFLFVSEVNGNLVGFANFSSLNEAGETELSAIYLYPKYQGKGIGTALLNEGIDHLESAKRVFIDVEKENKTGLTFYQAKGFEIVSEFDDNFNGHILKTVRMVLNV